MSAKLTYMDEANQMVRAAAEQGVLLVSGKTPNPMTIGWCAAGVMWGMEVFMAPVRASRYTHAKIQECGEFTVCVPADKSAISICGSQSGRDVDKLELCGFKPVDAHKLNISTLDKCELYLECVVVGSSDMAIEEYEAVASQWYGDGDMHTLYFGKIVDAYIK